MKYRVNIVNCVFFGLLALMIFSGVNHAKGQCELKVESKVETLDSGPKTDIYLKVIKGSGSLDFYLIDLKAPQKGPIQQKTKQASTMKDEFVLVFGDVSPSNYTIQVIDAKKCQISIGGVRGITISNN